MREFKFRVWNGFRIVEDEELRETAEKLHIDAGIYNQYEQDILIPRTEKLSVMQYTVLKDRNGKEIYEGDIVKLYSTETDELEPENYTVIYTKDAEWSLDDFYLLSRKYHYCEVIGNIYENPELLK